MKMRDGKKKKKENVYYVWSLRDVRVYRLVLIARRNMTRRTSFSCWNEGMRIFCFVLKVCRLCSTSTPPGECTFPQNT